MKKTQKDQKNNLPQCSFLKLSLLAKFTKFSISGAIFSGGVSSLKYSPISFLSSAVKISPKFLGVMFLKLSLSCMAKSAILRFSEGGASKKKLIKIIFI